MILTKKLSIPKEIYVTAKMHKEPDWDVATQSWVEGEGYALAFLHPHEPNKKTDAKRKNTQIGWVYGWYCKQFKDEILEEKITWVDDQRIAEYEPAKYQPRILSNEPLTGFEIFEVATRYSTSNKVFRVKDPRGFVTEITAKSLLGILLDGTTQNGVIQDACIWQSNKNLVVWK